MQNGQTLDGAIEQIQQYTEAKLDILDFVDVNVSLLAKGELKKFFCNIPPKVKLLDLQFASLLSNENFDDEFLSEAEEKELSELEDALSHIPKFINTIYVGEYLYELKYKQVARAIAAIPHSVKTIIFFGESFSTCDGYDSYEYPSILKAVLENLQNSISKLVFSNCWFLNNAGYDNTIDSLQFIPETVKTLIFNSNSFYQDDGYRLRLILKNVSKVKKLQLDHNGLASLGPDRLAKIFAKYLSPSIEVVDLSNNKLSSKDLQEITKKIEQITKKAFNTLMLTDEQSDEEEEVSPRITFEVFLEHVGFFPRGGSGNEIPQTGEDSTIDMRYVPSGL